MVAVFKVTVGDGKDGEDKFYTRAEVFMKGEKGIFSFNDIIIIILYVWFINELEFMRKNQFFWIILVSFILILS